MLRQFGWSPGERAILAQGYLHYSPQSCLKSMSCLVFTLACLAIIGRHLAAMAMGGLTQNAFNATAGNSPATIIRMYLYLPNLFSEAMRLR